MPQVGQSASPLLEKGGEAEQVAGGRVKAGPPTGDQFPQARGPQVEGVNVANDVPKGAVLVEA